ncbi:MULTISPECIES: STAS domain-containing protein [Clostridium]|uniref:STAS domain-containing protein n=1 Tax=Clostridium TaxID=1485 RepID=UPI00069E2DA3|nr:MULTISPECIES: STAS domain-containing protein [Clostridium]KOF57644.1 anti-sigma factor antagonist [Clostridium sp. DMHC 10]MCD2348816.1 STAS domain-containing protein [Clostridium guangxiense]
MKNITIPENFSVEEASEYRKKLNELVEAGEKNFTLDFSKCTFIDSTGLGVLVNVYKKCTELNGTFILSSITNPQVLKIFKLTRLDKVFKITK